MRSRFPPDLHKTGPWWFWYLILGIDADKLTVWELKGPWTEEGRSPARKAPRGVSPHCSCSPSFIFLQTAHKIYGTNMFLLGQALWLLYNNCPSLSGFLTRWHGRHKRVFLGATVTEACVWVCKCRTAGGSHSRAPCKQRPLTQIMHKYPESAACWWVMHRSTWCSARPDEAPRDLVIQSQVITAEKAALPGQKTMLISGRNQQDVQINLNSLLQLQVCL